MSSISCCLFSAGMISYSDCCSSSSSFFGLLPNEVILLAISYPSKSPVASAFLANIFLPAILPKLIPYFFVISIIFLPYLLLLNFFAELIPVFTNFLPYLLPHFLANNKKP